MSTPPGDDRDVISNLPRSRRQRPSARREAARAQRAGASAPSPESPAKPRPKAKSTAKPRATAKQAPKPKAAAAPGTARAPRRSIPPAGYAAPRQAEKHGSDPAAAITGLVRGVLKRLPF